MRFCWRLSLDERRRTDLISWRGMREPRDRFGRLPTRFFAETSEFLFVEAFVVFLEDLLGLGQILLLNEYVASAAESSCTSGAAHAGNACLRQASEKKALLDWIASRGEDLEHLRKGSERST